MAGRTKTTVQEPRFSGESIVWLARRLHCILCIRWRPEALVPAHVTRRANQATQMQIAAHVGRYRSLGGVGPIVLQGCQCLLFSQRRMAAQAAVGFILAQYAQLPEHPRSHSAAVQTCPPVGVFGRVAGAAGFGRKRGLDGRESRRRLALRRQRLCPIPREKLCRRVRRRLVRCLRAMGRQCARHHERQRNYQDCTTHFTTPHTGFE